MGNDVSPARHPLEAWLPVYEFVETHSVVIRANAGACLDAAEAVDPADDRLIQMAMALREAPGRLLENFGKTGGLRQRPCFSLADFLPLGRDGDRSVCHGLVGQFWRFDYALRPQASPQAYAAFNEAGVPKLALSFHTQAVESGGTRLVATTRVHCPDETSRRQFRRYWWLIRPVSGLIRVRLLRRIRTAAESTAR